MSCGFFHPCFNMYLVSNICIYFTEFAVNCLRNYIHHCHSGLCKEAFSIALIRTLTHQISSEYKFRRIRFFYLGGRGDITDYCNPGQIICICCVLISRLVKVLIEISKSPGCCFLLLSSLNSLKLD